jgi:hypothetical protein
VDEGWVRGCEGRGMTLDVARLAYCNIALLHRPNPWKRKRAPECLLVMLARTAEVGLWVQLD